MVRYPPWYLISQRHICAIPHFATYRATIVRYPIKTSAKVLCDTIATSIARYEKYRCWASKFMLVWCLVRMGKTQICAILVPILENETIFQKFVCVGAEKSCICFLFSQMRAKLVKIICTHFGVWAEICTKMFFLWHVGLVVCFV